MFPDLLHFSDLLFELLFVDRDFQFRNGYCVWIRGDLLKKLARDGQVIFSQAQVSGFSVQVDWVGRFLTGKVPLGRVVKVQIQQGSTDLDQC